MADWIGAAMSASHWVLFKRKENAMGMYMHVVGFRPPDEHWQRMKAARDACKAAKIPIPKEVDDFFEGEEPDPAGVEVNLSTKGYGPNVAHEWYDDSRNGYELAVDDIPPGVKLLRFYCSY